MPTNRTPHWTPRWLAALIAAAVLVAAVPQTAFAEDEGSLWVDWWNNVTDRVHKSEIPFVILFTIPPMLVVTPIWAVTELYTSIRGHDEASDDD